jgi:hypothetical protein
MALEQRDRPIANGRPNDEIGPPIYLYHPVFLEFHSKVQEMSVEIPADFQLKVYSFLTKASVIYPDERRRREAVDHLLAQILAFPIMATQLLDGTSNNGCITIPTGFRNALLLLLETKNEVGTGGCDPSAQAAYSTRKFWVNEKVGVHVTSHVEIFSFPPGRALQKQDLLSHLHSFNGWAMVTNSRFHPR